MTASPAIRPQFDRPPIREQVFTLRFERIRGFDLFDGGCFWSVIKDTFPEAGMQPRVGRTTEFFDGVDLQLPWEIVPPVQLPRAIYRNEESGEVLQVQDDMFSFNWTKVSDETPYPHFEHNIRRFWDCYNVFRNYIRQRHGSDITFIQCELTNVNVLRVDDIGEGYEDLGRAFNVDPFSWNIDGLVTEAFVRQRQHRIVNEGGTPLGRLHSVISPGMDHENRKAFRFELVARSIPSIRTVDEAVSFFDRAHVMINGAFLASITEDIRKFWGERNG